jgi:hypothetical protein
MRDGCEFGGNRRLRGIWRGCRHSAFPLLRLKLIEPVIDGRPHVILHFLQIRQAHGHGRALAAIAALAGQNHQIRSDCIRGNRSAELNHIAFRDLAPSVSRRYLEAVGRYEHMSVVIADHPRHAARAGIGQVLMAGRLVRRSLAPVAGGLPPLSPA